jgi:hypothetical protein
MEKQYGKGKGPEKGRNLKNYREGWEYALGKKKIAKNKNTDK